MVGKRKSGSSGAASSSSKGSKRPRTLQPSQRAALKKSEPSSRLDVFETGESDNEDQVRFNKRKYDNVGSFDYDVGAIDHNDDEDIDEDEAFNESDEEKWGMFFTDKKVCFRRINSWRSWI